MHHAGLLRGSGHRDHSQHRSRTPPPPVARGRVRQHTSSPPRRPGGWPRRDAAGAVGRSPSRRRVDFRSGVHPPAGSGPGSSPGRPRRAGPLSRSSSDACRCRSRRLPGARTGRDCSASSPVNSTTAGSTTATWSPSRSCSTSSTRRSVAGPAPAGASPHRRQGPTDRGDVPADGVTRSAANVTPAARPSQATGCPPEAGENIKLSRRGCHQWAAIGAFSHKRFAQAVGVRTTTWGEEKR
jgi:hypothetical protein